MNVKEMEVALLRAQGVIEAMEKRLSTVEGHVQTDPIPALGHAVDKLGKDVDGVGGALNELRKDLSKMNGRAAAYDDSMDALRKLVRDTADAHREDMLELLNQATEAIKGRLQETEAWVRDVATPELKALGDKVHATNKSAPIKRNMTDEDALAILTGKYKEDGHKVAAEKIGLTYAQVYSARGEFTFKHVHKVLRESGWKNPWAK